MLDLKAGDRIKAIYKKRRTLHVNEYDIVSVNPGKSFIVVNNGKYNTTLDKDEIIRGKVKIKVLSRKEACEYGPHIALDQVQIQQSLQDSV